TDLWRIHIPCTAKIGALCSESSTEFAITSGMCWNVHRNDFILNRSKAPIHPESADPGSNNDNPTSISSNPPHLSAPGDSLGASRSTGLDSSPVVKANETATEASEGQNPPASQAPPQAEDTDELDFVQDSAPISADTELGHNRHEMFSM